MNKTIFILIFLILSLKTFSQYSYFKEAIITKKDDLKIQGYVEKISESSLNPQIKFKTDIESKDFDVIPVSEINELIFLSDSSLFKKVRYEYEKDTIKIIEYRLAKKLVDGYAQLFKLQLPEDELNIIFENDNTYVYILLLENQYYVLDQDEQLEGIVYKLKKNYQGKLFYLLREHKDLQKKVWNLQFSDKQFVSFIDDLNKRYPEIKSSVLIDKEKILIVHGPNIGISIINSNKTTIGNGFSFGYDIGFIHPQVSEKYSSNIGIYWNFYQTDENSKKWSYIRIPIGGTYSINKKKISPYFRCGISLYFYNNIVSRDFFINGKIGIMLFKSVNINIENDFSPNPKVLPINYTYFNLGYLF